MKSTEKKITLLFLILNILSFGFNFVVGNIAVGVTNVIVASLLFVVYLKEK